MKKIKVLHIVEALGGGIYSYFTDLTNFFEKKNAISTFVAYSDKRNEINPVQIKKDFSKATNLTKASMRKEISPLFDLLSIIHLIRVIKKIKPDIIHLHSSKAGALGRISHYLSGHNAALYYTPHGYSFLRRDVSNKKQRIYRFIENKLSHIFEGSTIACGDTEFYYAKSFGKAYLIRNGVNIPEIRAFKKPVSNKKLRVGILGRITHARNPSLFNSLALKFLDIEFVWIGDGELRNLITAPNVEITGWFTDRKKGLSILNTLDIYIQTSLWEGLPISVIEAMTLEKPVIATDIIGNKDLVKHGETGFLFKNINEFENYLEKLKTESFRKKIGKKAFERVQELFDYEKNFETLTDIYYDGNSKRH